MVQVHQHYLGCLAQASYTIVSEGKAFVIDPRRDVEEYLEQAKESEIKIIGVALTHIHADFVAGHQELAKVSGCPIYMGNNAKALYEHTPVFDKQEISFGKAKIVFWETPGHTPGDITLLLFDTSISGDSPVAIFSGDTIFNGDVGRPDLLASFGFTQEELASQLYDSIYNKIMTLPDETIVYPGHGQGSLCGKKMNEETITTIGEQKRINYAFHVPTKELFIDIVTEGLTTAPNYFLRDATINKNGIEKNLSEIISEIKSVELKEFKSLAADRNFQLIDSRDSDEFAKSHIPGFMNFPLDGKFAMWTGILLDPDRPILLIAEEDEIEESVTRLSRVGLENVAAVLTGGIETWFQSELPKSEFTRVRTMQFKDMLSENDFDYLVDVRAKSELDTPGMLNGAIHLDLMNIFEELETKLPNKDAKILLYCRNGHRSATAASILLDKGYTNTSDMIGGIEAWKITGLPLSRTVL